MTVYEPVTAGRRAPAVVPIVVALGVLLALFAIFAQVWTDRLWFGEVGFTRVFDTAVRTRALLFVTFGLVMAAIVVVNVVVAHRLRPAVPPDTLEQRNLDRYRAAVVPRRRLALAAVAVLVGIGSGLAASTQWQTWLRWRHGVRWGVTDPQFHRDIAYYAFTYPFQRMVVGFLFVAVFLSLVAAVATHYLFASIRLQARTDRVSSAARAHVAVLLGLFVALKAYAYYLDQFGLAFSPRGKVTGASYTDVHAQLPALRILVLLALICALLFFGTVVRRGWVLPGTGLGLMLVSSLLVGGAYPLVVQQLRVKPNEITREAPYIARNIAATREAYQLRTGTDVTYTRYSGKPTETDAAIRNDKDTVANARLLDPNKLRAAFESLQQIRGYYGFPKTLDIDRYDVAGHTETYVVGAREIDKNGLAPNQRNWINQHLVFTHGNGLVAAPTNEVDGEGNPSFDVRDIPPTGTIRIDQPRVYYGEQAPDYSVVGTTQQEVDQPAESGTGDVAVAYQGKGGVGIGGLWRRVLFATRFRTRFLVLSGALRPESKILYVRNPRERVRKVAPYLELDQDPYPVVVGGRIVWIVDGYTTSNGYPYAERVDFNDVTSDSASSTQPARSISYIRNSVKATVDAYDGTVTLYRWDDKDPVLRTWERVFPGTLRPRSEMPADLVAHVRYPEDLFKVQRDLLASYHIDDPAAFFREADFWAVPGDPSAKEAREAATDPTKQPPPIPPQPPYYVYGTLPGEKAPRFQLTSPLTARSRPNLAAYVSVVNDPDGFGHLTVLELPTNTAVPGPIQRGSTFQTSPVASQQLALFDQHGSEIVLGNLLTLPVGGGLVYVQPVYVQSTSEGEGGKIPQLKRVFVGFGDSVGFGQTYAEALDQAFHATAPPDVGPVVGPPGPGASGKVRALVADAQAAMKAAAAAYGRQDYTEWAKQQERLRKDLALLTAATS